MTGSGDSAGFPSPFRIGDRWVGKEQRCLIVCEVAQNHDGSFGMAHSFIDAIAKTGADAVKFQTHIAAAESTSAEPWRVPFSVQDASRYDYWKRMEFSEEQWQGLRRHAQEVGLEFISSPFSIEAVDLLSRVGVTAWKVASGEVTDDPMLERMAKTGLPILLSTGMSPVKEIDHAVQRIKSAGLPLMVLQCTSSYPCPAEKIGLNLIPFFRERYGCSVGLSDHSGAIYAGLAAAAKGIEGLEVHVTFSPEMFGPDIPVSLTMAETRRLVEGVRQIEKMLTHPVDKDGIAGEMGPIRNLFTKSIAASRSLSVGTILLKEHLTTRKPGTGIPATHLPELLGRRLRRDVEANQLLCNEDFDPLS